MMVIFFIALLFVVGRLSQALSGQLVDDERCMAECVSHADLIIDRIYLGSVCAAHNRTWLSENNISFVFNVAREWNTVDYQGNIEQFYFALDDATNLDIKTTRRFINTIASRLVDVSTDFSTSNILVHCNMGISRSATIVVRYLQLAHHLTYRQAIKLIKDARPIAKPNTLFKRMLINMDL